MTPGFQHAADVFLAVCSAPREQRESRLDALCAGDVELRNEVLGLLAFDDAPSGFDAPASGLAAAPPGNDEPPVPPGTMIGRYRIVRRLGTGGMGHVYEAEQAHPRRTIALKLIRPGLVTPAFRRRFEHEAQALGRLQHPGIAQIHDAGTADTSSGRVPFLAMERIEGAELLAYAQQHGLDARTRVELLARVCDAVHHAHQKGVIHRDLKPGNILVDASGQPKVLDFGVARVIDERAHVQTLQTDAGQLVGTLPYMSPEQVAADPSLIDTRCDVYALGAVGYELLSGDLPLDVRRRSIAAAARIIQDDQPAPLGARDRALRGDLEVIIGKALEKEPDRRYPSAAELAEDLRRFLRDEPIAARPPSTVYQIRKFARRHRGLVGGALTAAALLVAAIAGTSWGMLRARSQARLAENLSGFFEETITTINPEQQGTDVRLADVIADGAVGIDGRFAGEPVTAARLHHVFGHVYQGLDRHDDAADELRQALEVRRRTFGPDDPRTLETAYHLAHSLRKLNELDEAESLIDDTEDRMRRVLGPAHPSTIAARSDAILLAKLRGRYAEAEANVRVLLTEAERALGPDDDQTLAIMQNLAEVLRSAAGAAGLEGGDAASLNEEADAVFRETTRRMERVFGPHHHRLIPTMSSHASLLYNMGRSEEAEAVARRALENGKGVLAEDGLTTTSLMSILALALYAQGEHIEAADWAHRANENLRRSLGESHPRTLSYLADALVIYEAAGRAEDGEAAARAVYESFRGMLGDENGYTLRFRSDLGGFLVMQERYEEAHAHLEAVIEHAELLSPGLRAKAYLRYGRCLTALGETDRAEPALRQAETLVVEANGSALSPVPAEVQAALAELDAVRSVH